MLEKTAAEKFGDSLEGAIKASIVLIYLVLFIAPILQLLIFCVFWLIDGYWTDFKLIKLLTVLGYTDMHSLRVPTSWAGINKIFNWLLDSWFGWTSYLLALAVGCLMFRMR